MPTRPGPPPTHARFVTALALAAVTLAVATFAAGGASAQTAYLKVTGDPLDSTRYADHKGSPYRFEEDLPGFVSEADGARVRVAALNYNGFTEEFEIVRGDGAHIALNPANYTSVYVIQAGDTLEFERGLRPRHPEKFLRAVYRGPDVSLFEAFTVSESEVVVQNVGAPETFLRFAPKSLYFLSRGDGKFELVSLRRKPFLKALADASNAGELAGVWKRAGGDGEARAAAVLAAYRVD